MAEDKDLKEGEEETPTDDDQSDNKHTESDEEDEDANDDEGDTDDSDDEVKISKSELERLRKDSNEKENYRKAVIRLNKAKGRNLPGSEPEKKKKADIDDIDDDDDTSQEEFVTRKEIVERDEKRAVSDACKDEEVLLNWDEIIAFYQRPRDNNYDTQLVAIHNAHKLWRADKGMTDKPEKEEKKKANKAKQDLASDKGLSKGKDKPVKDTKNKRNIISRRSGMDNWYK